MHHYQSFYQHHLHQHHHQKTTRSKDNKIKRQQDVYIALGSNISDPEALHEALELLIKLKIILLRSKDASIGFISISIAKTLKRKKISLILRLEMKSKKVDLD